MAEVEQLRKGSIVLAILLLASLFLSGAAAETMNVEIVQISDPVMYRDGELTIDLSGLTLQLTDGVTADGSLSQFIIDLYAGDENINSAIIQQEGELISFFLGGMKNAYSMSVEDFEAEFGSTQSGLSGEGEIADLESWGIFEEMEALVRAFIEENSDPSGGTTTDVSLAAGDATMTVVPFEGDCTELFLAIARSMDADVLFSTYFGPDSGESSMEEDLQDANLAASAKGSIAQTEDGTSMLADLQVDVTSDGEHTAYQLHALLDGSESVQRVDLKYMEIGSDLTQTIQANGTIDGAAIDLTATIINDYALYYGTDALYDVRLTVTPGIDSANGKDSFELAVKEEHEHSQFTCSGYWVEETGEARVDMVFSDKYFDMSAYVGYTPDETPDPDAVSSGSFEFGAGSYGEDFRFACDVRTYETTIDSDAFYIDPASAVDSSNMSDIEQQAIASELAEILYGNLGKLEEAVPALRGLMDGLFGYSYDEMY